MLRTCSLKALRLTPLARIAVSSQAAVRTAALPPQVRGVSARHARTFAASASDAEPKHYLLTYEYVPDILEKRGPHRPGHLAAAQAQIEAGNLLKGGPLADPVDGAVFLFKCADPTIIDDFVAGGQTPPRRYTI
ncbi:hypothetical protein CYMTET_34371 [Cymbomonas tetramitiformis]|uniref:YCII-related domain-containing protein n=1 Tax=Cymbomonas tetramitiformis TaxID=36881 RepID=A0AAE0FB95_9CHLO|nr:hypothetical protein CYMTET_34371 [Cymbomonas tetramitiformis]